MAKIEEQQKAIHNLKSNLMDDLNEKGVLSDPECQRVIQIHQQVGFPFWMINWEVELP